MSDQILLPVSGVEVLRGGAFVKPFPTLSTLKSDKSGWDGIALESYECMPGCSIPEHEHPSHFLSLQTSGQIRTEWTADGSTRSALHQAGSIYLLPRGSRHRHSFSDTSSRIIVTIESKFLAGVLDETSHQPDIDLIEHWELRDRHLAFLMMALHADLEDGQPAGHLYGESLGAALAVYLINRYSARKPKAARAQGGLPRCRLQRVLDYIDQHLDEDIRLKELSKVACMSSHYFSELFRQSMGTSPHKFVISKRVERAKRLLRDSGRDMLDIALACGFSDQSHFSKTFRRVTGTMPSTYRFNA